MLEVVPIEDVRAAAEADLALAASQPEFAAELVLSAAQRRENAEYVTALRAHASFLPELPEASASEVYERVTEAECMLAAPRLLAKDYNIGTATYDDQLYVVGSNSFLLTEAQHGTAPVRKKTGVVGDPDHGTSGLAYTLAVEGYSTAIIPLGRQTGNANVDPGHGIKQELNRQLKAAPQAGFLSIHGMAPGKMTNLRDISEIHAIVGLGLQPREASITLAERLRTKAKDRYGLRVVIGNEVPHFNAAQDPLWDGKQFWDRSNIPERDADGTIKMQRVAAMMKNSTTTYMTELTAGRPNATSIQVEMSRSLRRMPEDLYRRDRRSEIMGVYLGYGLTRLAAELSAEASR
ncbi:MAG TPA: hypothetical protein VJ836_02570 [Candidatus Saccharimonadales bacterium]|nr:hypothetical protein [Candidatus Saccharimonadales bacterium]